MTFAEIIARNASSPARDQVLTDGRFTCAHSELPGLLDGVSRHLDHCGVGAAALPALECINSTAGALTLLALLRDGRRFLLTPGSGATDTTTESKPIARFCDFRITILRAPPEASADWLETPERFLAIAPQADPLDPPQPSRGGKLYLRTSGSMGAAKIVVHDHARLLRNALNCLERFGLCAGDRVTLPVPIFHMYGLGAGFLSSLAAGASIHLEDHSNILRYLESERRFRPDVAFLNPLLCDMLLRGRRSGGGYRRVVTSTQRISEDTFRAFDDRFGGLLSLYGSTEMGAVAACLPEDSRELRATTLGPPMRDVQLRLADDAADGSELLCLHPYGYEGYLDDRGQWLQRAAEGEWYRTGDLARGDGAGGFSILGRANLSVNRSGYLVLLSDIEKALETLPEVAQAAVVAAGEEDRRGQRLAAFCTLRSGARADEHGIRAACFEHLPKHAIPDRVHVLEALPLLPSGKLDRQTLLTYTTKHP